MARDLEKVRAYSRLYYAKNRAKCLENNKRYREQNPEYDIQYRQKNRERINTQNLRYWREHKIEHYQRLKKWRKNNPEKVKAQAKKWRADNPEKTKKISQVCNARRNSAGYISREIIQRVYEDNIKKYGTLTCILCLQRILFGEDSLEHKLPISRGGTNAYENLGIAHFRCNRKKYNKTMREYLVEGEI